MISHKLTMIPVRENSEVVIIYPETWVQISWKNAGSWSSKKSGGVDQSKSEELSGLNLHKLKEQGQKINPQNIKFKPMLSNWDKMRSRFEVYHLYPYITTFIYLFMYIYIYI